MPLSICLVSTVGLFEVGLEPVAKRTVIWLKRVFQIDCPFQGVGRVAPDLPDGRQLILVADRGFGLGRWLWDVQRRGFDFVQRLSQVLHLSVEHYDGTLKEMGIPRIVLLKHWGQGHFGRARTVVIAACIDESIVDAMASLNARVPALHQKSAVATPSAPAKAFPVLNAPPGSYERFAKWTAIGGAFRMNPRPRLRTSTPEKMRRHSCSPY